MEIYQLIKTLHMTSALLSVVGLIVRYGWSIKQDPRLQLRWVKIFPHINDTLLLVAGIFLVYFGPYSPIAQPGSFAWLIAKWVLLLVYIIAGSFALKRATTEQAKMMAMLVSLVSILLIFYLAFFKPYF